MRQWLINLRSGKNSMDEIIETLEHAVHYRGIDAPLDVYELTKMLLEIAKAVQELQEGFKAAEQRAGELAYINS